MRMRYNREGLEYLNNKQEKVEERLLRLDFIIKNASEMSDLMERLGK